MTDAAAFVIRISQIQQRGAQASTSRNHHFSAFFSFPTPQVELGDVAGESDGKGTIAAQ